MNSKQIATFETTLAKTLGNLAPVTDAVIGDELDDRTLAIVNWDLTLEHEYVTRTVDGPQIREVFETDNDVQEVGTVDELIDLLTRIEDAAVTAVETEVIVETTLTGAIHIIDAVTGQAA